MARNEKPSHYRVIQGFAPAGAVMSYAVGDILAADDPVVRRLGDQWGALLQPLNEFVDQATVGGDRSVAGTRMPSAVTADEASKARDVRVGPRNKGKVAEVPHSLPPEHEDSAASTFAPFQPAAGVQADDVVEKGQAPAGALSASEATAKFAGKVPDTSPGHTGEAPADAVSAPAGVEKNADVEVANVEGGAVKAAAKPSAAAKK